MKVYECIIFDFNGVLWWDNHLQEQSWNHFSLTKRGIRFTEQEMTYHVHGRNFKHTLTYLLGYEPTGDHFLGLIQEKETIYRQLCLEQGDAFKLSPGAVTLLDFLVQQDIPRTIATASERTNLDFFIEHLDLACWFDIGQIAYDDGTLEGKPAPDFYLKAASNLDLDPDRCVVVEDAVSGIQAANAAGIGHIIALGPLDHHQRLAALEGVSQVVTSLAEVPKTQLFLS